MNKLFYARLAATNIKKNSKTYIPFILTCIGSIMMFYNMCFLAGVKNLGHIGEYQSLRFILNFGAIVIGVFSVIFLFYTNSFLIKRRKKEFGLFNILGMEKKHIAKIMLLETLFVAFISILSGLLAGILFSKLMVLLLFKIINFKITFGFEIPFSAVLYSIVLFTIIFAANLIYNLCRVHLSKPVELLTDSHAGEKEPKTKWILAAFGTICLGIGYYIALTTESPLAALYLFLIATILVIIGTYCLFTAGSIAVLKILKRNKKYYYKLKHFTSVSGMIYRMKQNAVGLANICILSTAVIIMLSTTLSMYAGVEDALRNSYPRNIEVSGSNASADQVKKLEIMIKQKAAEASVIQKDIISYRYIDLTTLQKGSSFTGRVKQSFTSNNTAYLVFIALEDYNKMVHKNISLKRGDALLYTSKGNIHGNAVDFNGLTFSIKGRLTSLPLTSGMTSIMANSYCFVVDETNTIKQIYKSLNENKKELSELSHYYGFDTDASRNDQISLTKTLQKSIKGLGGDYFANGCENVRGNFLALYGGLFFLGLFLGLLFIMATVLIIYYKQISEGYEDKERFNIMQKVGMSHTEVKKSIRSQVLMVFFLPLIAAVIHLAFAFKVITKMLSVFDLTNVPLFAACTAATILVFTVFYAVVYVLTARTYYRIVS